MCTRYTIIDFLSQRLVVTYNKFRTVFGLRYIENIQKINNKKESFSYINKPILNDYIIKSKISKYPKFQENQLYLYTRKNILLRVIYTT